MPRVKASDFEKLRKSKSQMIDEPEPLDPIDLADEAESSVAVAVAEPPEPEQHRPVPDSIIRRNEELHDAEQILIRKVDGLDIRPDEESFLGWLFGDEFGIANQSRRVRQLRTQQKKAGTAADRQAAKVRQEETALQLREQGPMLQATIDEAQAKLDALKRDAEQAGRIVEGHDAAVLALNDPAHLNDADRPLYERLRKTWERDFGRPSRTKRQEAAGCLEKSKWTIESNSLEIISYCQAHKDPAVRQIVGMPPRRNTHEPATGNVDHRKPVISGQWWRAHAQELRDRAERLHAEADQLEQAGAPLKAELDEMLQSLVPG